LKTFALVEYHTKVPVNRFAYTSANDKIEAFRNFISKRSKTNPKQRMFPDLAVNYETSKWKIVEVPQKKAPAQIQMQLYLNSFENFIDNSI
jgi:hypothetical protein